MGIKQWPKDERPREKLLRLGAQHLSDAELLAILLRVGLPGCDVMTLSRDLLNHFGSLRQIMTAKQADLLAYKGMGPAAFCQFAVVLEIGKRVLLQQQQKQRIHTLDDVHVLLQAHLAHETVEVLLALWLDSDNALLSVEEISRGSLAHHTVYVRELAKRALAHNAAALILAHNHPSGCVQASIEDKTHTRVLQDALALLDVNLLDHIIVGGGRCVSIWYNADEPLK